MSSVAARPDEVFAAMRRHVSAARTSLSELTGGYLEVESSGTRVRDAEGREFLACGGYGVFLLGHRHPRVVEAVREQLDRHPLTTRFLAEPRLVGAATALASVAPDGLEFCHFVCSGAEATETALKLARLHGKRNLISMHGGFHGKTTGALTVTARPAFQDPFRPLLPSAQHVPFGDLDALATALRRGEDHCVVIEPVQAEAGVNLPPPGYLAGVSALCREHGAMLVVDEIQTGLGRLGSWWGIDGEGVVPDVLLVGKTLSGGVVPVAAALATPEVYEPLSRDPLLHSSTFAGAPLAMAAAEATLAVIAEEGLVDRARVLGEELMPRLRTALEPCLGSLVRDVRGRGLLIGVDFELEHVAADFVLELLERRIIVNHSLSAHNVVRLTPPATFGGEDVEWLIDAVAASACALAHRYAGNNGRI